MDSTAQQDLIQRAREARQRLNEPRVFHPSRPVTLHAYPGAWRRSTATSSSPAPGTSKPAVRSTDGSPTPPSSLPGAGVWPDDTSERTRTRLGYRLGDTAIDDTFIGTWHSHPNTRNSSLSPGDLADDVGLLEELPRDRLVSVITTFTRDAVRGVIYEAMAIRR